MLFYGSGSCLDTRRGTDEGNGEDFDKIPRAG